MARGGYFHGDEYIPYKAGNLADSSSSRRYAKKTIHNSGTYNKSRNIYNYRTNYKSRNTYKTHNKPYTQFNDSNFKPNWSCAPDYDENYYERNKHRIKYKTNKKSTKSSNSDDTGWIIALLCICVILAIFISFAIDMPIAFFLILLGLLGIVYVFFWIVEELPKKIKSSFKKI